MTLRDGMVKEQMLVEMKRQPAVLQDLVRNYDRYYGDVINDLADKKIKRVYIAASGSSYHAGVVISNYMQTILKVNSQAIFADTLAHHECFYEDPKEVLVICISQSGTSTTTVAAIEELNKKGCLTIAVSQHPESFVAKAGKYYMEIMGKETHCPETGGYTSKIMMFYLFALKLANRWNRLSDEELEARLSEAQDFADNYQLYLDEANAWYFRNEEEIKNADNINVVGYGINYGTAIEAKLKISESTRKFAGGYETEEYIHGHVFSTNRDTFIFTIASEGVELERFPVIYDFFKNSVTEHTFAITAEDVEVGEKDLRFSKKYCSNLMPLAYVTPFQVMAYYISVYVGRDTTNLGFEGTWPARKK